MGVVTGKKPIGLTEAAQWLHCQNWQIGRLMDKGLFAARGKVGKNRYVYASDLPALRDALIHAGYLEADED
jgi:hypothetical protein